MKKALLFIASQKGYIALKTLTERGFTDMIGGVFTFREVNVEKSYDTDIVQICQQYTIPCYRWKEHKDEISEIIQKSNIICAFAIGWKFLISLEINKLLKYPFIVFHDSLLPKYRGFAPTPTAIICGESKIGISALYATKEVDRGDIILQKSIDVLEDQMIEEIIAQQSELIASALLEILAMIRDDMEITALPQDETKCTYSLWRSPQDCQIDWHCSARYIYNLVRAVSFPYLGAFTYMEGKRIQINKLRIVEDCAFAIRDCGKIWSITENQPTVVCGTGMLQIVNASDEKGQAVVFSKLRVRLN